MDQSRRDAVMLAMAAIFAPAAANAQTPWRRTPWIRKAEFMKDSEQHDMRSFESIHHGIGKINVKFFRFDGAPAPANYLIYDIPPGSSEGTHVHRLNDEKLGSFDEYYYMISGSGVMEIDDQIVQVAPGDHVFTPLDVRHGIENTSKSENLKVFLTFILRS